MNPKDTRPRLLPGPSGHPEPIGRYLATGGSVLAYNFHKRAVLLEAIRLLLDQGLPFEVQPGNGFVTIYPHGSEQQMDRIDLICRETKQVGRDNEGEQEEGERV